MEEASAQPRSPADGPADGLVPQAAADIDERLRLARFARRLAAVTLVWLAIEGGLGIFAGAVAGSVALIAFGCDSAIEAVASVMVLWRFQASRISSAAAERRAQRGVAISFFLLAPYVAAEGVDKLLSGAAAKTSWLGIVLTAATIVICPWLGLVKQNLGRRLGSGTVSGEGAQNLLCTAMASGVLVSLAANALWGLWWLDPAVAVVIAAICVREGRNAWRGETCSCAACAMTPPA